MLLAGEAAAERFRDWRLVAGEDGSDCLLIQALLSQRTGTMLAQVVLQTQGAEPILAFRVPTGASLVSGIGYRIDGGEARAAEWIFCDPELCLAVRGLAQSELAELQRGRELTLAFRPLRGSPALNLPVSLLGVSAGWQALLRCE